MQESSFNHESAYAIVNRVSVLETKLHDIQSALEELLQTIKTSSSNEKRNNRRENPYGTHYCWTHGWVNHKGCDCSNKKQDTKMMLLSPIEKEVVLTEFHVIY